MSEEEATRLKSIVQAFDVDKQKSQQEVQAIAGILGYFRNTTVKDEFTNRLKLDLNFFAGGKPIDRRVPQESATG